MSHPIQNPSWQRVRELEHEYKRLALEVVEHLLLSAESARAGDGKGAGVMLAGFVDRIFPLREAREAYLNKREEVAAYCEDAGALSAEQAEIAVLRRKLAEANAKTENVRAECEGLVRQLERKLIDEALRADRVKRAAHELLAATQGIYIPDKESARAVNQAWDALASLLPDWINAPAKPEAGV